MTKKVTLRKKETGPLQLSLEETWKLLGGVPLGPEKKKTKAKINSRQSKQGTSRGPLKTVMGGEEREWVLVRRVPTRWTRLCACSPEFQGRSGTYN